MIQPPDDTTAAVVRAELARRRLKQNDVATALGLTQSAMSRRLVGEVEFSVSELRKLSEILEVPASTLLGEVPA